jgi:hypothetical protein
VVLASMMNASTTDQKANAIQLANIALTRYGILLAEHYGKTLTKEDLSLVGLPSEYQCNSFGSFEERRTAFNDIADFVKSHLNLELEPLTVAQIRGIAMHEAGVDLLGRPLPAAADTPTAELSSRVKRFIDSEFVGVYW